MPESSFYAQVRGLLDALYRQTGRKLDVHLTGYAVEDAVHINIDRAMEAIVRTEYRIAPRMQVDLRELINVNPPVDLPNLFITFSAESAQFNGGNATAFGIHFTRVEPSSPEHEALDEGVFVPGAQVTGAYRLVVFLRMPSGDVSLARTGVVLGLDPAGRLVSYRTFQFNPGLSITHHPPSSLSEADPQVMLYIFLTLSVFLMVNQGEAPVHQENETVTIG